MYTVHTSRFFQLYMRTFFYVKVKLKAAPPVNVSLKESTDITKVYLV